MSLRDKILSTPALAREQIVVPEWGVGLHDGLFVQELTGEQRDAYESARLVDGTVDMTNARAHLAALSLVDADGKQLFTPADMAQLGKLSAKALDRVFAVAAKLSGLMTADDPKS